MTDFKNPKGFTLVELMLVVALIGMLASIASVNYQKFASRARIVEAKLLLANLYLMEQLVSADQTSYTGCLGAGGGAPEGFVAGGGGGSRYYTVGLHQGDWDDPYCGPNGNEICSVLVWPAGTPCSPVDGDGVDVFLANSRVSNITPLPDHPLLTNYFTYVSTGTFTFVAVGSISTSPPAANAYDVWSIDQNKQLLNVVSVP